jgi:hypothetical protein
MLMKTIRFSPFLRFFGIFAVFALSASSSLTSLLAQAVKPATNVKFSQVSQDDMRQWLTYLASDELQGRQVFTEGYGLAAQYVADRLREWGVKPLGANGSYLQPVRLNGYKVTRNSSVTIESNGQTRTFKDGDHVTFAANAGGKQTLTFNRVEFVGYRVDDVKDRDLKGALVVIVPNLAPPGQGARAGGAPPAPTPPAAAPATPAPQPAATIRLSPTPAAPSPAEQALTQAQAALTQATAALVDAQRGLRQGGRGAAPAGAPARGGRAAQPAATVDFTTVQRLDGMVPPQLTGDDTFFDTLFTGSGTSFSEVKAKAEKGEAISPISITAKVTITIDQTYDVIAQQTTHNVVGLIEGSDPRLKDTYVLVGAHLDHIGYSQTGGSRGAGTDACRRRSPAAQAAVTAAGKTVQRPSVPAARGGGARGAQPATAVPFEQRDVINNGADDDGSGSTAVLAIAKAFATGPKPKRSVIVVWHAGEESGLYGSRFNADFPIVPLDKVQTELNIDMVGRDDCDNIEGDYSNTLFIVGADRISTDLHNVIVETNQAMRAPLALDYELNDRQDPENIYTRSDHFSYASKGIPIAFFTTGLHPDYHRVTDTVDKIRFDKMARIAQLVYQTGFAIANSEAPLARDNKGSRTGFGTKAEVIK